MKKILVVEDNETNRYLISYLLRQSGYRVVETVSGEDGVAAAVSENPDLILMDVQLPGIDGLEATRWIRASISAEFTPIVALTAHAMVGDRERALRAGCDAYIEKPIMPGSFVRQIEEFFETEVTAAATGMGQ